MHQAIHPTKQQRPRFRRQRQRPVVVACEQGQQLQSDYTVHTREEVEECITQKTKNKNRRTFFQCTRRPLPSFLGAASLAAFAFLPQEKLARCTAGRARQSCEEKGTEENGNGAISFSVLEIEQQLVKR